VAHRLRFLPDRPSAAQDDPGSPRSYSAVTSQMLPAGNKLCYPLVMNLAPGVPPEKMAFYSEPERSTIFQNAGDPAAGWRGERWHWP